MHHSVVAELNLAADEGQPDSPAIGLRRPVDGRARAQLGAPERPRSSCESGGRRGRSMAKLIALERRRQTECGEQGCAERRDLRDDAILDA